MHFTTGSFICPSWCSISVVDCFSTNVMYLVLVKVSYVHLCTPNVDTLKGIIESYRGALQFDLQFRRRLNTLLPSKLFESSFDLEYSSLDI